MKRFVTKGSLLVGLPISYLYAFMMVMGRAYTKVERHPLTTGKYYLLILILGGIAYPLIVGLWDVLSRCQEKDASKSGELSWKHKLLVFCVLFLAWMPCWLAAYPGFFCYDATQEFNSVYTKMFSAHHPILHSMLLTYPMMLSERLWGSFNGGIVIYCLFQMLLGAGVFTYVICFLQKYTAKMWVTILALLYYMFSPVIVLFSSCTTKDVLSGLLVTAFLLRFYELYLDPANENDGKWTIILFCIPVALVVFSKKNLFIAMLLFLVVQFCCGRNRKKRIVVLFGGVLLYYLCNSVLMRVLNAEPSSLAEMLSIPAQQIAAVYTYEGGEEAFTESQWETVCNIFAEEELEGNYCPWVSDPIKQRLETEYISNHSLEFVKLWLGLFFAYPERFVNAFNYMTYQAWYPFTDMTGYNNTWYTYQEFQTCFFACTVEAPGKMESKWPALYERMRHFSLQECIWKKPVLGMLCSVGFHMWVLLFSVGYSLYKGQRCWLILLLFPCCLIATNLMGPIVLVRYYIVLFYLFPVVIGTMLSKCKG